MSGRHRKCIAAASYPVLASIALVAGCTELPPFDQLLPADLDPSLAYVYNHADSFAQARDDPLSDVTAGTVKEDLESLSGCWGAYVADVAKGDAPIRVDEYDLLVFEAETHRLTAWNLENYGGLAPIVVEQSGNYAITHGSRIEFTITGGYPAARGRRGGRLRGRGAQPDPRPPHPLPGL